ncbi:MAG: tetratricopeptide repeat protein [Acidithiobacillus sp.]
MLGRTSGTVALGLAFFLALAAEAWALPASGTALHWTAAQISQLERSAREGYAPAQYRLGLAYAAGAGVDQNLAKAVHWWRLAAKNLNAPAQLELGDAYAHGWGVEQNTERAIHYWKMAATDGHRNTARQAEKLLDSAV